MSRNTNAETVSIDDMNDGDVYDVHLNGRASEHLGSSVVRATVDYVSFDVRFRTSDGETFTVHGDTSYVMAHHDGLGRVSDVGKCLKVTETTD